MSGQLGMPSIMSTNSSQVPAIDVSSRAFPSTVVTTPLPSPATTRRIQPTTPYREDSAQGAAGNKQRGAPCILHMTHDFGIA